MALLKQSLYIQFTIDRFCMTVYFIIYFIAILQKNIDFCILIQTIQAST
jgi:hypothetical protein